MDDPFNLQYNLLLYRSAKSWQIKTKMIITNTNIKQQLKYSAVYTTYSVNLTPMTETALALHELIVKI